MAKASYKKQAAILLAVLPEVAKETCFALHGGTAMNLFVRNLPRLSVDIDLTYVPIEDRSISLANIADALERIKTNIERVVADVHISHRKDVGKLQISADGVDVKLEVSLVSRGTLSAPVKMTLCAKAQEEFEAFCAISVIPFGQLYGGKICAALDRQHPRDLFDVKYLLDNEGYTEKVKEGFYLRLLSGERPINEILFPNLQNQRATMDNQFSGMSEDAFSYEEYEEVRERLITTIHENLTQNDKEFILSFKNIAPDWSIYDFERFPAITWKLQNLHRLKDTNPDKHGQQYAILEKKLNGL